jgi:hypothetical protein
VPYVIKVGQNALTRGGYVAEDDGVWSIGPLSAATQFPADCSKDSLQLRRNWFNALVNEGYESVHFESTFIWADDSTHRPKPKLNP